MDEGFFEGIVAGVTEAVLVADRDGVVLWAGGSAARLFGLSTEALVGMSTFDLQHPDDARLSRARRAERPSVHGDRWTGRRRAWRADGTYWWADTSSVDLTGDPRVGGVVVTLREAREQHHTWETERRLRAVIEHAQDAIVVYGPDLGLVYRSPNSTFGIGVDGGSLLDHVRRFVPEADRAASLVHVDELTKAGTFSQRRTRMVRPDGSIAWVDLRITNLLDDPAVSGIVLNVRDVTEQVALENELRERARSDPLTALPNRTRVLELLDDALGAATDPATVVVLFLDLDRFKVVNDSFGHRAGDRVLVELGGRLQEAVGSTAVVGRFGGDEFVVVAPDVPTFDEAGALAEVMAEAATAPFIVEDQDGEDVEVCLSASVGIALGATDLDAATLLHQADAAMYRAKARGRGTWELYDDEMRRAALHRLTLEAELSRALDRSELSLHYQPIVALASGRADGVEGLARWQHAALGSIPPHEFIPVAEETGGIHRLGSWAIATAAAQLLAWDAAGLPDLVASVNLSPRQLSRAELADELDELLAEAAIDPRRLCLEITESVLMDDFEAAVKALSRLRDSGIRLALDDFGTGWSSLTYLRSVPVDAVKIDRSFITGVASSENDRTIVGAVISMCDALGKQVIAEGVETEAQLTALGELGCSHAQGYLFSRPVPGTELTDWLRTASSH